MTTIKSYQDANEYLGNKDNRPFANNTRIKRINLDRIVMTYHDNPVVTFTPNEMIFSSCGWKTLTTKERINWALPEGFYMYQSKSVWHVTNRFTHESYIFQDGFTIASSGEVYNYAAEDTTKETIKSIKKYVDGYVKALLNGEIDSPSAGDCFYCVMHTTDGESLGDATKNNDHILSHFEESYFVPSLIVNADKMFPRLSPMSKDGIARLWEKESISDWQKSIVVRDVKSCLTTYLKHCLGIAQ